MSRRMVAAGRIRTYGGASRQVAEVVDLGHRRGPLVARRFVPIKAAGQAHVVDLVGLELQEMARRMEEIARDE